MSEKIVQLNEEVIKGQLKELVRGSGPIKFERRGRKFLPRTGRRGPPRSVPFPYYI